MFRCLLSDFRHLHIRPSIGSIQCIEKWLRGFYISQSVHLLVKPNGFLLELFSEQFETVSVQCLSEKQLITN